jgi:hypothetical protein
LGTQRQERFWLTSFVILVQILGSSMFSAGAEPPQGT